MKLSRAREGYDLGSPSSLTVSSQKAKYAIAANSLNSEILSRLFESFEVTGMLAGLETQLTEIEANAEARIGEVQARAEQVTQRMERALAEFQKLKRRVEGKLE